MQKIKISKFSHGSLLSLDNDTNQRMHSVLILCISIVTNIFEILIDGQEHRIRRHSRVLE